MPSMVAYHIEEPPPNALHIQDDSMPSRLGQVHRMRGRTAIAFLVSVTLRFIIYLRSAEADINS